ncbi:15450_t:CDS:2 [Racocetra fulgida]|uniref:15450_t:CDS:1 n=1 Tax=Racocetra fulgida TaxID=60492 RepID=A0A9N9G8T2_9GLOM|nr:15450_t:CDS:2 [Racocetra fulgida]
MASKVRKVTSRQKKSVKEKDTQATQRLYRELRLIVHKQDTPSNDLGFYVKLDQLHSIYQWVVQLKNFDPSIPLAQDMARHNVESIELEVRFAPDYPNLPPYVFLV